MRRLALFAALAVPLAVAANAQPSDSLYYAPEVLPAPVGGLPAVTERVVYPESALSDGVEGQVVVRFVVEPDGTASHLEAVRSPDDRLSEAALAAVQASPFTPGRQDGTVVRAMHALPITFRLPEPPADVPGQAGVPPVPPTLIGGLRGLTGRVVYPEAARRAGVEGTVLVTFIVDEDGRVMAPEIASSDHPALNRAALDAVIPSRFTPGQIGGQPVKVRYTVPVSFRLRPSQPRPDPFERSNRRRGGL